jgi:hypothetical protein
MANVVRAGVAPRAVECAPSPRTISIGTGTIEGWLCVPSEENAREDDVSVRSEEPQRGGEAAKTVVKLGRPLVSWASGSSNDGAEH